jgi:hypothetical protein
MRIALISPLIYVLRLWLEPLIVVGVIVWVGAVAALVIVIAHCVFTGVTEVLGQSVVENAPLLFKLAVTVV